MIIPHPTNTPFNPRQMPFKNARRVSGGSLSAKYRFGQGRSMNERDLDRFRRVQDAIYAVRNDENPVITFNGKRIIETTNLPRGSQRCYRTATTNGETWAISWADKIYVRSIQERPKNNPPYKQ